MFRDTCVQVPLPHMSLSGAGGRQHPGEPAQFKRIVDFLIAQVKCPESYAAIEAKLSCATSPETFPSSFGRKAYLRAMCRTDGNITIDCREPLPPENW
jgi:hypothetical protein